MANPNEKPSLVSPANDESDSESGELDEELDHGSSEQIPHSESTSVSNSSDNSDNEDEKEPSAEQFTDIEVMSVAIVRSKIMVKNPEPPKKGRKPHTDSRDSRSRERNHKSKTVKKLQMVCIEPLIPSDPNTLKTNFKSILSRRSPLPQEIYVYPVEPFIDVPINVVQRLFLQRYRRFLVQEGVRLATFGLHEAVNENSEINSMFLAADGLYCDENGRVQCFFCSFQFFDNGQVLGPGNHHHYPLCRFVRSGTSGNVPISSSASNIPLLQCPRSGQTSQNSSEENNFQESGVSWISVKEENFFQRMVSVDNRRATFRQEQQANGQMDRDSWSLAGFVYQDSGLVCFYCKLHVSASNLPPADTDLFQYHASLAPHCLYILMIKGSSYIQKVITSLGTSLFSQCSQDGLVSSRLMQSLTYAHPDCHSMADVDSRIASFRLVTRWFDQEPSRFAEAGFYFIGFFTEDGQQLNSADNIRTSATVQCFSCQLRLQDWQMSDIPIEQHARRLTSACRYLALYRGQLYIDQQLAISLQETQNQSQRGDSLVTGGATGGASLGVVGATGGAAMGTVGTMGGDSLGAVRVTRGAALGAFGATGSASLEAVRATGGHTFQGAANRLLGQRLLAEENDRLMQTILCNICHDRERNIIFIPCGHLVCCEYCAAKQKKCPSCGREITGKIRKRE